MVFNIRSWVDNLVLTTRLYYSYSRLHLSRFKRKTRRRFRRLKLKAFQVNGSRRRNQRRATARAADVLLPSLPGISKLRLPEPPVPQLLLSNDIPTEVEVAAVRAAVACAEAEKERLRTRLVLRMLAGESNRTWEAATRHKIGRASSFIRQHQGVISPLRHLPSEIMQEIFMQAVLDESKPSRSNRDVPWYLSQVCHRWRAISLSITALWSRLPTMILKKGKRRNTRQLAAVKELIKRAGNAPLTFAFFTRKYTSTTHPLLSLLMDHAERWQSATFQLPQNLLASLNAVKERLPLLETVIVRARTTTFAESPTVFDVFSIAPRLRTVTISGITPSIEILLPFSQLINYTDRSSGTNLLSTIFQPSNCISLESLTILEISEDTPFPAFTLPKLNKLVVREYNWHNVSYFCNLDLPSIEEIKFMSYGGQVLQTLIGLLSNNTQGAHTLKTLIFRCESAGDADAGLLTQLLTLAPNITYLDALLPPHLDINNLVFGDTEHRNKRLVPGLKTCKFYIPQDWGCTPQDVDALNALASARCGFEGTLAGPGASSLPSSETPVDPSPLLPCEAQSHSLDTFLLYCDFTHGIPAIKQHLNIGHQVPPSDLPEWEALSALKERLKEDMPELLYIHPYKERTWNLMWKDRMNRIMDDLERFEWKNAQLVYHLDFPLLMRRMRDWSFKTLENTGLSRRAREILEKWDPVLERDLVPSLNWASKGSHSLIYLSNDDPLRKSDKAIDIAYTLPEVEFSDIYWPTYMSWNPSLELIDYW